MAKGQQPRPKECIICARPLITRQQRQAGMQGRVHAGKGWCEGCASTRRWRAANEPQRMRRPDNCSRCNEPLRARKAPDDGVTQPYAGRGYCVSCWMKVDREQNKQLQAMGLL